MAAPVSAPRAVAIVPVRTSSRRLPGKALLAESGKPLFLHTCEQALRARCFDAVYVATDSPDVVLAAESGGVRCLRTSDRPRTGSERCAEAAAELDAEWIVDLQGDWPEIDPADLERLVLALRETDAPCATLAAPLSDPAKENDPNVVKVVRGLDGRALYFSRCAIPYVRDGASYPRLRHVGVYAFDRTTLLRIPELPSSGLDVAEGLEQLRFLENGIEMLVVTATGQPWGIETRADYDAFLRRIAMQHKDTTA